MRRFVLLMALTLLVVPAFGQDDGDNSSSGGGFDDLFSGDLGGNTAPSAPKFDPLVDLRAWLISANAPPLEQKQENPLNKIYEKELKAMSKAFEKQFGVSLKDATASQNPGRAGRLSIRTTPQQAAEIRRLQAQLVDKVIAGLRIDQQGILRRYQSDQLRVRRLGILTQGMDVAGMPLTPEQKTQVEALYARESQLRALIIVESKGQSYDYKVAQLETQTTQRVERILELPQRVALVETLTKLRLR
jgi:hypothetical protein